MLKDDLVSSATYNSLPHISNLAGVSDDNSSDPQQLRALLVKYNVPNCICIRLVHKHFDVKEGEATVLKTLDIPKHGSVSILRPSQIAAAPSQLHGFHYFVNADGLLQAYEYSPLAAALDMFNFGPFLVESCRTVDERGFQHKLGLEIGRDIDTEDGWTEFEFNEERRTIIIPEGCPKPEAEYEFSVETEFHANPNNDGNVFTHTRRCAHCSHPVKGPEGLYVGERKIEPGTPFHDFYIAVVEVW